MKSTGIQLRLDLLGTPQVHLGDTLPTFPTRKTLALLIYLPLEGGQQPRELLAALLWPSRARSAAMHHSAVVDATKTPGCRLLDRS